jgi:hypothetical protein
MINLLSIGDPLLEKVRLTGGANLIEVSAVQSNLDPCSKHVLIHLLHVRFADLLVRQERSNAQDVLFWPASETNLIE